ncbi:MAG: cohesin domain-containing protein [Bacillota bacterium]|nr:cohesin domain-containing protein [Bacillota bacterium]
MGALCLIALASLAFSAEGQAPGEPTKPEPDLLTLENQYVKIVVNAGALNTGRFALETTGGDPDLATDDHKPLIYGRPRPWTSYTTVRVDEEDYVFGGRTEQRAGRDGKYGQVIKAPAKEEGRIVCAWKLGPVEVVQTLSLVPSTTTGWPDTMEIRYQVTNTDSAPHLVGLRIVLDTMLGENDGAPLRFGEVAQTRDALLSGDQIPTFWQAFDSLSQPKVTAQGTLRGDTVTVPDRVYVSNWGSLADGVWDFDFRPGRELIRAGEYELDSALALRWEPLPLGPGQSRVYVTAYGLGGITIAPGELLLGATSPATVWPDRAGQVRLPVVAYVQNGAQVTAHDLKLTLHLPAGLAVAGGQPAVRGLGSLPPGETAQAAWEVVAQPEVFGQTLTYTVTAEARNAKPNSVQRQVRILAPPQLKVQVSAPRELRVEEERLVPRPFRVEAVVENGGPSPAYLVWAELETPGGGLVPAAFERPSRFLGTLQPGERVAFFWSLEPRRGGAGKLPFAVKVNAANAEEVARSGSVSVPPLSPKVWVRTLPPEVTKGGIFTAEVVASNIDAVRGVRLAVQYDPQMLELIYLSRGTLFVEGKELQPWSEPRVDREQGKVEELGGTRPETWVEREVVARLHFQAKQAGVARIKLAQVEVFSSNRGQTVVVADGQVRITE